MALALIVAVLALVLAAAWWSYQQQKKRRQALQSWARANGMSYSSRDDSQLGRWQCPPFTDAGFDHRATEVLSGPWRGHQAVAFTYSYKTRSTDGKGNSNTETHRFGVAVLSLPEWLPGLRVTLETPLTRLGGHLGLDDIDLESEAFNRRYRVKAEDRKFAVDVLNPRTMEALLAGPACAFTLSGADALAWHPRPQSLTDVLARWTMLQRVIEGIPEFVWKDADR